MANQQKNGSFAWRALKNTASMAFNVAKVAVTAVGVKTVMDYVGDYKKTHEFVSLSKASAKTKEWSDHVAAFSQQQNPSTPSSTRELPTFGKDASDTAIEFS